MIRTKIRDCRLAMGICLLTIVLLGVADMPYVFAEQKIIEGDGFYTIGDGLDENISVAKDRAKAEAMRNAGEKAGVFVESLSIVQEGQLTHDEVMVISAQVMQLQGMPKFKAVPITEDVLRYECHVTVLVDTDNINASLVKDKAALTDAVRQNKELTEEVERLNREMEDLRQRFVNASTENERQEIRQEVRRNDEGFVAAGLNEQGAKLLGEGRYAEAAGLFSEALEKNPDFAYAYHNRGIAYGKMKDYGRAVADFSRAIALNGNYASAYVGRGFALYSMGEYERAIADLRRAVALKPDYADAFYIIGNAYMQLGHYEEALRDYEKALALNPSLEEARKNRDMLANAMQN